MSDPIRDLDDVEAQAWATIYAAWSTFAHESAEGHADDGVRLLRERRGPVSAASVVSLATRLAAACGREADAVAVERAKIATWLRNMSDLDQWATSAGILLDLAISIERGEHDR